MTVNKKFSDERRNKMIYVVVKETNEILKRFEAWAKDSYTEARKYIKDNGYVPLKEEITTMGDMVIWVA